MKLTRLEFKHCLYPQAYIPSCQMFLLRYTRAALRSDDPEFYSTCTYILDTHLVIATHSCSPASHSAAAAVLLASLLYHESVNGNVTFY